MSEFEGFEDADDPRYGNSSVEPPEEADTVFVPESDPGATLLGPEAREVYEADLARQRGVTPQSKDAHLEGKVVSLPPLMVASDLLPDEEPLPSEPPDADTPPDDAAPTFIVVRNAFGPGSHSVKFSDGTPVGVWAAGQKMNGADVWKALTDMGLDEDLAEFFARNRDKALEANRQLAANPVVAREIHQEAVRLEQKRLVQEAFVKAQRAKERK